jgi:RNA polymerase sigma-70 factor (ECF subfamily)
MVEEEFFMSHRSSILVEQTDRDSVGDPVEHQKKAVGGTGEPHAHQLLITRITQGDVEAFADLVARYGSLMVRRAYLILGDQHSAEDAVQESLVQAWQHLPALRDGAALRPWLLRIVTNQCLAFKRKSARWDTCMQQVRAEHASSLLTQTAQEAQGELERNWDLAQIVKQLPSKQRAVILLHYYHDLTVSSMAHVLHTSENTIKKRLQAALITLRRLVLTA